LGGQSKNIEAVDELQEVPNEGAAMETLGTLEDRFWDEQPAVSY
jgi:hypothetical protein